MNDKIDDLIKKEYEKINISEEDSIEIRNRLNKRINKRKKVKIFTKAIVPTIIISSTCIALTINHFNLKSVKISDTIIEEAANNGYIQVINTDYIVGDKISIKVNKLLIDDNNFELVFDYKMNNEIYKANYVMARNLKIYDENNIVLYQEGSKNSICSTMGYTKPFSIDKNTFEFTFFANSFRFPNSKLINIEFDNFLLNIDGKDYIYTGNWKYSIFVDEKMINRKSIEYRLEHETIDTNFKIEDIRMTNTGLVLNISGESQILNNLNPYFIVDGNKYEYNNNIFDTKKDKKIIRTYIFNVSKDKIENDIRLYITPNLENIKLIKQ